MDRINTINMATLPNGGNGFKMKNVGAGIPGTKMSAVWCNSVQEELMTLLSKANIKPDVEDYTQVWQSIEILIANAISGALSNAISSAWTNTNCDSYIGTYGFQKFKNGIMFQWGIAYGQVKTSNAFAFPWAFNNECLQIFGTDMGASWSPVGISPNDRTSFTINLPEAIGKTTRWFAIGY